MSFCAVCRRRPRSTRGSPWYPSVLTVTWETLVAYHVSKSTWVSVSLRFNSAASLLVSLPYPELQGSLEGWFPAAKPWSGCYWVSALLDPVCGSLFTAKIAMVSLRSSCGPTRVFVVWGTPLARQETSSIGYSTVRSLAGVSSNGKTACSRAGSALHAQAGSWSL